MSDKRQRSRSHPFLTVRDALLRELRDFVAKEATAERETKAWWTIMKDADAALRDLLAGETSIEEFRAEHMRADGHGTSRLSMTSLVNWLMNRASEAGPDQTVDDLERYVTSPTFPVCFSIGIRGASATDDIQLADGIEFVPRAEPNPSDFSHEGPISTGTLTLVVD